eukprot:scpid30325/ scgid3859/ 
MRCAGKLCSTCGDGICRPPIARSIPGIPTHYIPLNKNPGVRPIGIGEVMRRVVGKAILYVIGQDIQEAAGTLQLCAGQDCGIEREACLRNMRHLCPSLATVVINSYRQPAKLFVGGSVIMSAEGTTQGDPIAMPMYALGILPLIRALSAEGTIQMWFADDSSAGGRVQRLRAWWDILRQKGPAYGYAANAEKSVLVVKAGHLTEAEDAFAGTGVHITTDGHRFLGAALGSTEFVQSYVSQIEGKRVERRDRVLGQDCRNPATGCLCSIHARPEASLVLPVQSHGVCC